jgi:hypothetical protein
MPACEEKTSKRFLAPRRVPPYIAADCQGEVMPGTTGGKMYKSYQNKIQWRWNNVDNLKKRLQSKRKSRKSKAAASASSKLKSRKSRRTPNNLTLRQAEEDMITRREILRQQQVKRSRTPSMPWSMNSTRAQPGSRTSRRSSSSA